MMAARLAVALEAAIDAATVVEMAMEAPAVESLRCRGRQQRGLRRCEGRQRLS